MILQKEPYLNKFYSKLPEFAEMNEIDSVIHNLLNSNISIFNDTIKYLSKLGGKKIRPYLCLLSAYTFSKEINSEQLVKIASAIELLHTSSLYHDDIIDNAELRRNSPSANKRYGLANSLLAGNFLYIRAFALIKELDVKHASFIENACLELTEGEALESNLSIDKFSIDQSIEIARLKTGSLFKLATYLGTSTVCDNQKLLDEMSLYGENLGIAFQIFDDISDITNKACGKGLGQDLRGKKPSIISTIWLKSGSNLANEFFKSKNNKLNENLISKALNEIQQGAIIEEALAIADKYQKEAYKHLQLANTYTTFRNDEYFQILLDFTNN